MDYYSKSKEEVSEDNFDKLPEDILHLIFNKIHDAKSLCNSLSVSKRFHFLVSRIDTLSLTLPPRCASINTSLCLSSCKNEGVNSDQDSKPKKYFLDRVLNKLFLNPLKRLLQIATQKSSRSHCECKDEENTFDLVSQVLKNFEGVKSLHVELPGHGGESSGPSSNNLLKWKAEFGDKLESCVILGATSSSFRISNKEEPSLQEEGTSTSFIREEELKERVVWIVSSLMAASARHYMVGEVVKANREVEKVVITDGSKQGKICFDKRQVGDLRDIGIEPGTELLERSRVPKLRMKLWYVPELEVEGGLVMKGATLVVIRPIIEGEKRRSRGSMSSSSDGDLVKGAFGDQEEKIFFLFCRIKGET
ncbi:hypothetical protein LguiA_013338 [Lonicera macranthoides]